MSTTVRKYPPRGSLLRHTLALISTLGAFAGLYAIDVPTFGAVMVDDAPRTEDPPQLSEREERQLQVLALVVLNPSKDIDDQTRRSAAEELVAMKVPQAVSVLADGLASEHTEVVRAVVSAMNAAAEPPLGLLEPAVRTLKGSRAEVHDDLALAIARYEEAGLTVVAEAAMDGQLPVSERLGPIQALAAFRSKLAAETLVGLLDPARAEPDAVIDTSCAALRRYTGLPNGDPESWRRWWEGAQHKTPEQWLQTRVERLTDQLVEVEAKLEDQRRRNQQIDQRLQAAYRELFPKLSYENQLSALPNLLDDELDAVRRFAVGQIDRLLRDTVSIPAPLQGKLAARLDDRLPEVRVSVTLLLDQLAYEKASQRFAERLQQETDPVVVAALLKALAKRPTADAIDAIRTALADPNHGVDAAFALWALVRIADLPPEEIEPTLVATQQALGERPGLEDAAPPLTGVLAVIGHDQQVTTLTGILDAGEPGLQQIVAEGFARRGLSAPLVARAGNELIYPFAVEALAGEGQGMSTVQSLLRLPPPTPHEQGWADGLSRACQGLDATEILAVDELLRSAAAATPQLRRQLLERITSMPQEAVTTDQRTTVAIRLAPLVFELGQPLRAREMLQTLGPEVPPDLRPELFRSALETGAFDLAASLDENPDAWIEVLEKLATRRTPHAVAVRDEIARRYGDQLGEESRQRFDAASALLPTATRSSTAADPVDAAPIRAASADEDDVGKD